jgi:hypothetical protein
MTWELHRGRLRYTRSFRRTGRTIRQYVGTGEVAELVARADELAKAARKRQAEAGRTDRERWETAQASVVELERITNLFVQATLLTAGYHRHDRGAWRRRRNHDNETDAGANGG